MLPIADQTAGPIGLKFFVDTQGFPEVFMQKKFEFKNKNSSTGNAGPFS